MYLISVKSILEELASQSFQDVPLPIYLIIDILSLWGLSLIKSSVSFLEAALFSYKDLLGTTELQLKVWTNDEIDLDLVFAWD